MKSKEIKQEFKELNVYLNDIYWQHTHNIKDAGHLWIAFSDKFRAFERRLLESKKQKV